jgi:hypothetical protein
MKDLTHYFQLPVRGKEDKGETGSGKVTVLNGNSDEDGSPKIRKRLSKAASVAENSSCPSPSSNSEIKSIPSYVRSSSRKLRSKSEMKFNMTSDAGNSNENVELDRHSTILQNEDDIFSPGRTPIKTSGKEFHNEKRFLLTADVGKQKLKKRNLSLSSQKVNNCDTADQSLSVKNKVLNETFIESSKKTDDSLLLSENRNSISVVRCKLKDGSNEAKKDGFGTGVTNETPTDDKISSILNERTNAFHILMSSRTWQSPHEHSPDETKDQRNSDRKKARTVIAEEPMKSAEIRENIRKRRKKLEDMVEKRRLKKGKFSDTSSEIEMEVDKKLVVRCRRIVTVVESDSDDDKIAALVQSTDTSKAKDCADRQVHREHGRMAVEDTDDKHAEPSKEKELLRKRDDLVNQDSLLNGKFSTRKSRKMVKSESTLSRLKNGSEHILEEMKDGRSESEQDHLHLVKAEEISSEKLIRSSTHSCYECSEQKAQKGRRKLVTDGRRTKKEGSETADRVVNSQPSIQKTEILPTKLSGYTEESVFQCSETPVKSPFPGRAKLVNRSHQESAELGKKQSVIQVEDDDSGERNQKRAERNTRGKTERASTVGTVDSKCETPLLDDVKKSNSLFSYFNKVSKAEVLQKPKKIEVKVQIHSPPVSPSVKKRNKNVPDDKRKKGNHCVKGKALDMEDQIVVLESHTVTPATDRNAVSVITPKKHDEINGLKTPSSSSGWKMRVRLRELPAQPDPDDTGMDFIC